MEHDTFLYILQAWCQQWQNDRIGMLSEVTRGQVGLEDGKRLWKAYIVVMLLPRCYKSWMETTNRSLTPNNDIHSKGTCDITPGAKTLIDRLKDMCRSFAAGLTEFQ